MKLIFNKVVKGFQYENREVFSVLITGGGNTDIDRLQVTSNHPIYICAKGFTKIERLLSENNSLNGYSSNGQHLQIALGKEEVAKEEVFDITVKNSHTYFVGRKGLWVHNSNGITPDHKIGVTSELKDRYPHLFAADDPVRIQAHDIKRRAQVASEEFHGRQAIFEAFQQESITLRAYSQKLAYARRQADSISLDPFRLATNERLETINTTVIAEFAERYFEGSGDAELHQMIYGHLPKALREYVNESMAEHMLAQERQQV